MSTQRRYEMALEKANYHMHHAGQYHGRFLTLHSDAKKLKKRHRDRVLCAAAFWNYREHAKWSREFAAQAEQLAVEVAKEEAEAAKQGGIFEMAAAPEAPPVIVGKQLEMCAVERDPNQMELF